MDLINLSGLTQTVKEPVLKEPNQDGNNGLRVDWGVRGFWEFQKEALFDILILNADTPSYLPKILFSYSTLQEIKKRPNTMMQQRQGEQLSLLLSQHAMVFLIMKQYHT